ncbi:multicopper oxidase domain-containing protein [Guyparkeria hydrothermalis]|uniref:multicopper oxidase domain-containing protein n=1 Tax=Guyparkeria TaxID=2035712 RepID=UPI0010ABEB73|nr:MULTISPECIES: multicopper oxidase domain-containing protein [Guyparkeria]MCL7751898.1 multicopper oxidase domain-containing protein [Guyparkeria hydrothermalis]TKA90040.1 biphenyl 2,3-dioxygenase [Guyparkeria sp. SB14A]
MDRRRFLKNSLAAATAATWGSAATGRAWARPAERPMLPLPGLVDVEKSGRLDLTAQQGRHTFGSGTVSSTLGYNQDYLGPIVRAQRGQDVAVRLLNGLDEPLATHWHGLLVPGEVDGGPHQAIDPGAVWEPVLPIDQPPSTAWFHAHTHPHTARQVYAGLAGVFQIDDGRDDERGLPHEHGVDDFTLVIQDRRFDPSGRLDYRLAMMDRMHGFRGDHILVNGAPYPRARMPRSIVRLRLLNGSNARIYHLHFDDGRPMHVIANDSGYWPKPAAATELRLAPGERLEVLVDFRDGREAELVTGPDQNQGGPGMMGMMSGLRSTASALLEGDMPVLSFHPAGEKAKVDRLPETIDDELPAPPTAFARRRHFTLDMMLGGMPMMRGMMGGSGGPTMGINGRPFDMQRINEQVGLGTTEHWTIESNMLMHPFHIHGVRFRVLTDEAGRSPRLENRGYKDTVLVDGRVEVAVDFTQPASRETPFMYHCHILEHEDAGMMGHFNVS